MSDVRDDREYGLADYDPTEDAAGGSMAASGEVVLKKVPGRPFDQDDQEVEPGVIEEDA